MENNKNQDTKATENERRIDHLENIVVKQTRTERHLEQNVDIPSSPENIAHAKQIQQDRQCQIDNLKNKIVYGENSSNNYRENTEKRLVYTEGYLNHNADYMNPDDIKNAERKQEHRKEQLDTLK